MTLNLRDLVFRTPSTLGLGVKVVEALGFDGRPLNLVGESGVRLSADVAGVAVDTATRLALLEAAQAGKIAQLKFTGRVCNTKSNRNHVAWDKSEWPTFCESFNNMPFLRDHAARSTEARGGTILTGSALAIPDTADFDMIQQIEAVKPWAITGVLDRTLDRFSIGWSVEQIICGICGKDWVYECDSHWPGLKYDEDGDRAKGKRAADARVCELLMKGVRGDETSAVNVPAVDGTGIVAMSMASGAPVELLQLKKEAGVTDKSTIAVPGTGKTAEEQAAAEAEAEATRLAQAAAAAGGHATDPPATPSPEDQAVAARKAQETAVRQALGLAEDATQEDVLAAIMAARQPASERGEEADGRLAKSQEEIAFLKAAQAVRRWAEKGKFTAKEAMVLEGEPANKQGWAMQQALINLAAFEKFAAEKTPCVPVNNAAPRPVDQLTGGDGLTVDDERVLAHMAPIVSREAFVNMKAQDRKEEERRRAIAGA